MAAKKPAKKAVKPAAKKRPAPKKPVKKLTDVVAEIEKQDLVPAEEQPVIIDYKRILESGDEAEYRKALLNCAMNIEDVLKRQLQMLELNVQIKNYQVGTMMAIARGEYVPSIEFQKLTAQYNQLLANYQNLYNYLGQFTQAQQRFVGRATP